MVLTSKLPALPSVDSKVKSGKTNIIIIKCPCLCICVCDVCRDPRAFDGFDVKEEVSLLPFAPHCLTGITNESTGNLYKFRMAVSSR